MKMPYTFSVLRYVHDPLTTEFVNVGMALYAADAKYLSAICTPTMPGSRTGEPRETKLRGTFIKAQNILHRMPCDHEFVQETNAGGFAKNLNAEVEKHGEPA